MDNSLNSTLEPSIPKSIFKKPTNTSRNFDASMNESSLVDSDISDINTSKSVNVEKTLQFRKSRKSIDQYFNVDSSGSINTSGLDETGTFAKPKGVFKNNKNKNKSLNDNFNVSYNETITSNQGGTDDSNTIFTKENPFQKKDKTDNEIIIGDSTIGVNESQLEVENEVTTFVTKENPFQKKEESITQVLEISGREEDETNQSQSQETNVKSILQPFQREVDSMTEILNISNAEGDETIKNQTLNSTKTKSKPIDSSNESLEKQTTSKNITVERSITNNSYFDQSSINDENLNNWMSDQSEEEIPSPKTPTVNLSNTKDKPPVLGSPTVTNTNTNTLWEQKYNEIISNAEKKLSQKPNYDTPPPKKRLKPNPNPPNPNEKKNKPTKLAKPAPYATKKLYEFLIKKLKPKYGIDTMIESENLVLLICETVKKITRRKAHQKKLIENLKKQMAKAGVIETTWDFYEFVIKFLPYAFRVKVVPCVQPVTNVVFPPKDVVNPFEKIL